MDGRARVRLRHDQEVGHASVGTDLGRQRGEARRDVRRRIHTQDAEARDDPQRIFAIDGDQVVTAVAKEREVIAAEPGKERLDLGELLLRDRRGIGLDLFDDPHQPRPHLLVVGAGAPNVGQHACDVRGQRVEALRLHDAIDLGVNEGLAVSIGCTVGRDARQRPVLVALHREDRMDDEVHRQAVPIDLHRHRVDEERHVVVDDLDDRVRRLPAVARGRVEHTHARLTGVARAGEAPVRERRAVHIGRRALLEVFRIDLPEIAGDETLEDVALGTSRTLPDELHHLVHPGRTRRLPIDRHQGLRAVALIVARFSTQAHGDRCPPSGRPMHEVPRRAVRAHVAPGVEARGAWCSLRWDMRSGAALRGDAGFRDNDGLRSPCNARRSVCSNRGPGWRNW